MKRLKQIRKENDMGFVTDLEAEGHNKNKDDYEEDTCECGGLLEYNNDESVISDLCSQDDEIIMTCRECSTSYHCI